MDILILSTNEDVRRNGEQEYQEQIEPEMKTCKCQESLSAYVCI